MKELVLEKNESNLSKVTKIEEPTNKEFFELFEKSEEKLKQDLNEYNIAYRCASHFYVK